MDKKAPPNPRTRRQRRKYARSSCAPRRYMVKSRHRHLENRMDAFVSTSLSGRSTEMAKIKRRININNETRWLTANSEQEYADKLIAAHQPKAETTAAGHDFETYARNWYDLYSKPNIETVTAETYKRQLNLHLIPAFKGLSVEEISTDVLQKFFNNMDGTKSTKMKAKSVLNMILEAAVEDGYITRNPLKSKRLKITGTDSKPTPEYTLEQMRYLVKHIPDVKDVVDRNFLSIIALHPLRLEEALGLKWEDIDTDAMTIYVHRAVTHPKRNQPEVKAPKTTASTRTISLSRIAKEYLTPGQSDEYVIGGKKPFSYQQVKRMCLRIQQDTGFADKITPIRFRTTVLTDIYAQTKDVKVAQAAAGHTTSAMTLNRYIKGRDSVSRTAAVIDQTYSAGI